MTWLPEYFGDIAIPTAFQPVDWHLHEMLFGFVPVVVTGFLLTAIPNWTGRLPLKAGLLLVLVAAWIAGRLVCWTSGLVGWGLGAAVDLSFLVLVLAAAAREVIAGRKWRHLRVLAIVAVLLLGNAVFHIDVHLRGQAQYGTRIGISATVFLVALIGGRIIPSFTRNWW